MGVLEPLFLGLPRSGARKLRVLLTGGSVSYSDVLSARLLRLRLRAINLSPIVHQREERMFV
jgi:hypothetical protein